MRRRPRVSWLPVAWAIVGLIVAGTHHFFADIRTVGGVLSAVLAVVLWPLVLLGVRIAIVV